MVVTVTLESFKNRMEFEYDLDDIGSAAALMLEAVKHAKRYCNAKLEIDTDEEEF